MSFLRAIRQSTKRDKTTSRELMAFMPAVLEVQETPPNPLAKWLGRLIISLFLILLVWAYFGEVNVVATARGQVVSRDKVEVVYPPGELHSVLVIEGQIVAQGQPVFSIYGKDGETTIVNSTVSGRVTLVADDKETHVEITTADKELIVEALLENKDVGFVEQGMVAEIKIDTFPFNKYGTIKSEIISIDPPYSQGKGGAPLFPIRSSLSEEHITVNGLPKKLIEGMAVSVEVQLGTRRVIEFFMAPLLRYQHSSLKER